MIGTVAAIFSFPDVIPAVFAGFAILGIALASPIHAYLVAARFREGDPRPAYTRWYGLIGVVIGFAVLNLVVRAFVIEPFRVPSTSMAPSYPRGTYILVEKWGYGNYQGYGVSLLHTKLSRPLSRADVIVFDYPEDPTKTFFKRVVGLPGDKVTYRDKRLSLNGVPVLTIAGSGEVRDGSRVFTQLAEKLGDTPHLIWVDDDVPPIRLRGVRNFANRDKCAHDENGFECVVPPGQYFVMGDNRDNSDDSRYWGFVPESAVIGKVWHSFSPKQ